MIAEPGLHVRSPIGLLLWMRTEEKTVSYKLGSRLKTPLYPIWLVVASDHRALYSGVLFSDDRNLLRDYRSEFRSLFIQVNILKPPTQKRIIFFPNRFHCNFKLSFCFNFPDSICTITPVRIINCLRPYCSSELDTLTIQKTKRKSRLFIHWTK